MAPADSEHPYPIVMPAATVTFAPLDDSFERCSAVTLGTGRFLRAVLVPALHELGCSVILAQTRGKSFGAYMQKRMDEGAGATYELDTVLPDGSILTTTHPIAACGTLGDADGMAAFMALPAKLEHLRYIGLGVTEAGLVHNGPSMLCLAEFLHGCFLAGRAAHDFPLSVLNTVRMLRPSPSALTHGFPLSSTTRCQLIFPRRSHSLAAAALSARVSRRPSPAVPAPSHRAPTADYVAASSHG
jgi:hypothetical protein